MIEVYCGYYDDPKEDKDLPVPDFCVEGPGRPKFYCLECEHFSYTDYPFAIAYVGKDGEVMGGEDYCIGFGGPMEPEDDNIREVLISQWEEICKKKIKEAWDEYMEVKKNFVTKHNE